MKMYFLLLNKGVKSTAPDNSDLMECSRAQLSATLNEIHEALKKLPETTDPTVFAAPENFFGSPPNYERECIDRNTAYTFFQKEFTQLSKAFPNIIIIPGSVYLSVQASMDENLYEQDSERFKAPKLYVQNVAPVFFNGEWIRLIKKGTHLKQGPKELLTEEDFSTAQKTKTKITASTYREDELFSVKNTPVFFGKTPLPKESDILKELKITTATFFDPIFSINNITFGLEICGDHHDAKLAASKQVDIHIIVSDGVRPENRQKIAAKDEGLLVQADTNLLQIFSPNAPDVRSAIQGIGNQLYICFEEQQLLEATASEKPRLATSRSDFFSPAENPSEPDKSDANKTTATESRMTLLQGELKKTHSS